MADPVAFITIVLLRELLGEGEPNLEGLWALRKVTFWFEEDLLIVSPFSSFKRFWEGVADIEVERR